MCTIITADRAAFDKNMADFIDRIQDDAKYNGHGFSLILAGKRADEVSVMRALNVELVISALIGSDWERFWFHSRHATGGTRGLSGCHAFHARHKGVDWYVMHNGVLRHPESNHFNVDSEWIASLITRYGPDAALHTVMKNESFANCFVVAPAEGKWYMLRVDTGSLNVSEDGQNYSTNKISGVIEKTVKEGTWLIHKHELAAAPTATRGSVYGNGHGTYGGSYTSDLPKALPTPTPGVGASTNLGSTPTTTSRRSPNDRLLGTLASLSTGTTLKGVGNKEWVKTGRGVWIRQCNDVLFFSGVEPNDKSKRRTEAH